MIKMKIKCKIKILKSLTSVYAISNYSRLTLIYFVVSKRLPLTFPQMK